MSDPPRGRASVLVGVLVLVPVVGVALWAYQQRVEAERTEQRARDEALAEEDRAWDQRRLARLRADRQAELAKLPGRLADAFTPAPPSPAAAEELGKCLIGAWAGDGRTVEYRADGTFRDREWVGTWSVARVTGTRVLHLARSAGPGAIKVTIEGDELIHDDEPGRASVLRRR